MIRSYSTLAGARRATDGNKPIIRLLDDPRHLFIPLPGDAMIYALDPRTGRTDGKISVLDLMAGSSGGDLRQGVTPAGHAILDAVDQFRVEGIARFPFEDLLRGADDASGQSRSGPLDHRRACAIEAAAKLLLAVELMDKEIEA